MANKSLRKIANSDFIRYRIDNGAPVEYSLVVMHSFPIGGGFIWGFYKGDSITIGYPVQVEDGDNKKLFRNDFPEDYHPTWQATLNSTNYSADKGRLEITFADNFKSAKGVFQFETADQHTISGSFEITTTDS
ncbi:hypothetical protein NX10_10035 [Pseudomonas fluorescens]|uniref:hypothetical protein n=1 Tax=Pseudomonas fluorescens group TaxID=136843 RepID=UPI00058574B0|nr:MULTISPECIES: hypothetical protein [Pseudomonas fluorescens group]KIF62797.1 hypothetical protein NX10_10035 [Pseudomonas fluorescens]MDR7057288.1 hypothetical protein [Pseudomonas koreensis]